MPISVDTFLILFSLFLLIFSIAFLYRLFFLLLIPMLSVGAPYATSTSKIIETMVSLIDNPSGKKAVDLGSGDGRLVIALAKAGIQAHGYEINPFLVILSNIHIKKAGLQGKAFIHWQSFWDKDFSQYNIVTVYGISYIMNRLETKLQTELHPGAIVISNYFTFPTWQPERKVEEVYLYIKQ